MARPDRDLEFTAYFHARAAATRRLAYALCNDWHLAEDLTQITFVKLYRHWRRIRLETVDAYTRRILVNTFLSHRRRRRWEVTVAEVPDRACAAAHGRADGVDLGPALAILTPRQRVMVVLRHLEDLPVVDVAALLGVAEGTVKSQTARGIQAMREALGAPSFIKE